MKTKLKSISDSESIPMPCHHHGRIAICGLSVVPIRPYIMAVADQGLSGPLFQQGLMEQLGME